MSTDYLLSILKIVIIDLALAGDNAVVIALAVRTLPARQQLLGRLWGTAGAVGMRLAFITVTTYLLQIPALQIVGGLLLLWIAVKLVRQTEGGGEGESVKHGTTLMGAIWVIIVADVVMSLDNVIAVAGAAHGDMQLVIFGIGLSIPIVVWGSGLLSTLMGRYPWIILVAAGILGEVAGKMLLHDPFFVRHVGTAPWWVEALVRLGLAGAVMFLGWLVTSKRGGRERAAH